MPHPKTKGNFLTARLESLTKNKKSKKGETSTRIMSEKYCTKGPNKTTGNVSLVRDNQMWKLCKSVECKTYEHWGANGNTKK